MPFIPDNSGNNTVLSTVLLPDAVRALTGHSTGMNLKAVLKRIERRLKATGQSADAASRKAGKPDAIRNMKRAVAAGRVGVSTDTIGALAEVLETSSGWLLEEKGPEIFTRSSRKIVPIGEEFERDPDPDHKSFEADKPFPDALPQMMGRIGGGSTGAVITIDVGEMQAREEVGEWWRIPPTILRGLARSDVSRTVGFGMDGDSMEPTIMRTDIVFVDTGRQQIEPDGIWAVDYGLGRTLKRIQVQHDEGQRRYILKSDNEAYPDQAFAPEEVTIFGRYIGRFSVF